MPIVGSVKSRLARARGLKLSAACGKFSTSCVAPRACAWIELPLLEEEAKERQREAGRLYGENHPKQELPEIFPEALPLLKNHKPDTPEPFKSFEQRMKEKQLHDAERIQAESRQKAAELTGTNRQYISDMKRYKDEAPEIYEAAKEYKKIVRGII